MKLYATDLSPNSRRVLAAVKHLGLEGDTEIQKYDVVNGEQRTDAFRAINPNLKVPVLVDDDLSLWEANPILIYLSDKAGAEAFCPSDPRGRIEILRWLSWEVQHYNRALGEIVWETIAKPAFSMGTPDQAKIDAAMENFRRFAAVLNDHLAERDFILGDTVTAADFAVGAVSALALHPHSQVPLDEFPNVKAWYLRLEGVPSWQATAPRAKVEAAE